MSPPAFTPRICPSSRSQVSPCVVLETLHRIQPVAVLKFAPLHLPLVPRAARKEKQSKRRTYVLSWESGPNAGGSRPRLHHLTLWRGVGKEVMLVN